ncbi:MAG: hypothetical protein QOH55_1051 [Microbacteriaceae bacterium]|jgi:hypothetical protein|nr:hypothetical protein [Microbacteriaceae bacterium]
MTSGEVTAALVRYESALRRLGAPVVANLSPGISAAEVRELEVQYGVELSDEVRAVWAWHNGVEGARGAKAIEADRMLVPHRAFGDLAWSLEFAQDFMAITTDANPASEFTDKVFVSLLMDNVGFVVNLTPGEPTLTYLNDPMSWSLSDYPSMPIAERIDWWTWAVENGAWQVDQSGSWKIDFDRYPQGENRNAF